MRDKMPKRKKYSMMFLAIFTVNGEIEKVRISQNSLEDAKEFFLRMFSPNCILNEMVDITNI